MGEALREVLTHFQVEVDDTQLEKFEGGLGHLLEKVKSVGERMLAYLAIREVGEFFKGAIEAGAHLADMSERLGVSTKELQQFQYAAGLAGVDAEAAAHSFQTMNRMVGAAAEGGGEGAKKFTDMGIQLKGADGKIRPVMDLLSDAADRFKDMESPQERAAAATKLFGRAGQQLIPLLNEGSEGLAKARAEFIKLGGGMDEAFIKKAKEIDDQGQKMKLAFQSLKVQAIAPLLPYIQAVAEWGTKLGVALQSVTKNTNVVQHAFLALKGAGVVLFLVQLSKVLGEMAVKGALAAAPWLVMAAAAGILFLAFDDLMTLMEGGQSVIGDALGPDKEAFVASLQEAVDSLKAAWDEMLPSLKEIGGEFLHLLIDIIPPLAKAIAYLVEGIAKVISGAKSLGGGIGELIFGSGDTSAADAADRETSVKYKALLAQQREQGLIPDTSGTGTRITVPGTPGAPGSGTSNQTTNHVTMYVSGDNPQEIAKQTASMIDTLNATKRK